MTTQPTLFDSAPSIDVRSDELAGASVVVVPVSCGACGGPLEPFNASPIYGGAEGTVVFRCTGEGCRLEWALHVRLARVAASQVTPETRATLRPVAECGTDGGYHRHVRNSEEPCKGCRAAHTASEKRRTAARAARKVAS